MSGWERFVLMCSSCLETLDVAENGTADNALRTIFVSSIKSAASYETPPHRFNLCPSLLYIYTAQEMCFWRCTTLRNWQQAVIKPLVDSPFPYSSRLVDEERWVIGLEVDYASARIVGVH